VTKINLLPPERIKERRRVAGPRSYAWLLIVLPLIVIVLMGMWYFKVSGQVSEKEKAIQKLKDDLNMWTAKVAELNQYKQMTENIKNSLNNVATALSGRVYWARILNEVAMMCPTDVWLTSLTGSSEGGTSGKVDFNGYALQCPNRILNWKGYPYLPDYKPIAAWLERMAQIAEFQRVWLSNASPTTVGYNPAVTQTAGTETQQGYWVISFTSSANLNMDTAVVGPKVSQTPQTPAPAQPKSSEGGG